ncbi:MAG: hypothetical protein AB7E55_32540 [Pigmentiphaga sp.]
MSAMKEVFGLTMDMSGEDRAAVVASERESALRIIKEHGARAWVFAQDAAFFWKNAGREEISAFQKMDNHERKSVLGEWVLEDWTLGIDPVLDTAVQCHWNGGITETTTRRCALLSWAHGHVWYDPVFEGEYESVPDEIYQVRGEWDHAYS